MSDVTVMHGDCLELMKAMPAESVNAIVTDPPYGQTNEGYDGPIAFGAELWRECYRVAKPNAALVSFAGSPTYHRIASGIEAGGWRVRQMWAWVYRDGFITSAYPKEGFDRLAPAMDPICFATKGRVLLNVKREGTEVWGRGEKSRGLQDYSGRASSHGKTQAAGRWPRSLVAGQGMPDFDYFALSRTQGGGGPDPATGHPNQKPLALLRWLVAKLPPGGVILDPFAGSGTTLVAALKAGHGAVGIEADAVYIPIINRRIAAAATPLFDGAAG